MHYEKSVMTYNCLNKLAPEYLNGYSFNLSDYNTIDLLNSATDLLMPRIKASYGQKSFAFREANEWNNFELVPFIHGLKLTLKATKGKLCLRSVFFYL